MQDLIAILEDDIARVAAMRTCIEQTFPLRPMFFEHAQEMISWLAGHIRDVAIISLDHDLPIHSDGEQIIDCGTGRQVVDYLITLPPACSSPSSKPVGLVGEFIHAATSHGSTQPGRTKYGAASSTDRSVPYTSRCVPTTR